MKDEPADPGVSEAEQTVLMAYARRVGRAVSTYWAEMVAAGVPEDAVADLASEFQDHLFTTVIPEEDEEPRT